MKALMTKALCLILLASRASALLAQGPSECGTNLAQLVVGSDFGNTTDLGYLPFEQNSNGRIIGFDAAVACEVAHRLGFAGVSFQQDDFDDLLTDLSSPVRSFDIVISALSITQDRINDNPSVAFIKYNEDSLGVLFNTADVEPKFTNPATVLQVLNDSSIPDQPLGIGVTDGSREIELLEAYPNLDVFSFPTLEEAVSALESDDQIVALFVDGATAVALAAGDSTLFAVDNVIAKPNLAHSFGLGIAVNIQCCQLYANIQKAIADMNTDGTLERLRAEFTVPSGFNPVPGLVPAACAGVTANIDSNRIANYIFSNYCEADCFVTALIED